MAPLAELETAVRSVAETWSRSQLQQAAANFAAAPDSAASPSRRREAAGRGRPPGRHRPAAALLCYAPSAAGLGVGPFLRRPPPLLLPPVLPSLPPLDAGDGRQRSERASKLAGPSAIAPESESEAADEAAAAGAVPEAGGAEWGEAGGWLWGEVCQDWKDSD